MTVDCEGVFFLLSGDSSPLLEKQKVFGHGPAWTEDQKSFLSSVVPLCVCETAVSLPLDSVSSGSVSMGLHPEILVPCWFSSERYKARNATGNYIVSFCV